MRCLLNPNSINQFEINDPNHKSITEEEEELVRYFKQKLEEFYYNSLLYASDDVLKSIRRFINSPNEENFFRTAMAMRKDLWNKPVKGRVDEWKVN